MFRAAEGVGPQTRPLLVFYGLSQAGRAITAAAVDLKGENWNLVSHGIHASGYHLDFADIEIRTDPAGTAGSFVRLSELLRSPVRGNDTVVRLDGCVGETGLWSTSCGDSRTVMSVVCGGMDGLRR
ncbi:YaaC family protein [Streptomyces nojiriensis]|uniref:YaaC family protein n=1 Tax=Streptomyces nojiriensis TaxID=66374 RepID=UPI003663989F